MRYYYLKAGEHKCGLHNHKRCDGVVDEIYYCVGRTDGVILAIIGYLCRKCGRRMDIIPQKEMENWTEIDTKSMDDQKFANFIRGL